MQSRLYEPNAVRKLGLPSHYASHGKLMGAWQRLRQPVYNPPARVSAQQGSNKTHAQVSAASRLIFCNCARHAWGS